MNEKIKERHPNRQRGKERSIFSMMGLDSATSSFQLNSKKFQSYFCLEGFVK